MGASQPTPTPPTPGFEQRGPPPQQPGFGAGNFGGFTPPPDASELHQMMAALTNASLVSTNMLYQLGGIVQQNYTRQQAQQGYRTLKPKRDVTQVTCATAELLMVELIQFEIDLQELGVNVFAEAAFFQLRAVTQGQAKDVVEFAMVREPMKTLHAAAMALPCGEEWEGGYAGLPHPLPNGRA